MVFRVESGSRAMGGARRSVATGRRGPAVADSDRFADPDRSVTAALASTGVAEADPPGQTAQDRDIACRVLCRQVENAEQSYVNQYGFTARDPKYLVAAGLLREVPRCPDGGAIIVKILGSSRFTVTCSQH